MSCPYCQYPHLINEDYHVDQMVVEETSCPLCGYSRIVHTNPPHADDVTASKHLQDEVWWRVREYDFRSEEVAEYYRMLWNDVRTEKWSMRERDRMPHPYFLPCPVCKKEVEGPEHDTLITQGHCGCETTDVLRSIPDTPGDD